MFCSHCGKEVTVGAKFCPNCGAAIESQPAPVGEQPKAPAVERMKNPIRGVTENSGQPGKGKSFIPKPLVIVAAALVLFIGIGAVLNLFGSDDKPARAPDNSQAQPDEGQTRPSESQITQNTEGAYREYNLDDFKGTNFITAPLTSNEAYQTAVKIYKFEDDGCGPAVASLFKSYFVDFSGNCGIDLTYIAAVGENFFKARQFFYKVEVEDIEVFRKNVSWHTTAGTKIDASEWTADDEIYVRCDYYPPDENVRIDFVFKNYSITEHQETGISTVEAPTIVPNEVEPSVAVPIPDDFWVGHWIGLDEGVEMNVASTDSGYDILISLRYGANDATEFRLTGEDQIGVLGCEGEEWSIHYANNGEPTETLIGNNCFGLLIENLNGESGSIRYEWSSGENVLYFVKWGEPLPEWYVREDRDF